MTARNMRVVSPNERPAPKRKPRVKTLAQAIEGGDYLEIMEAQRRDIAKTLSDANGPAAAALHRQLSALSKEIEDLKIAASGEKSVVSDTDDADWDDEAI